MGNGQGLVPITAMAFFLVFALWWGFTLGNAVEETFLPAPSEITRSLAYLLSSKSFLLDIATSFLRVLAGFAISMLLAVPLGIFMGMSRAVQAAFEPLATLRYIPPSALIPLSILWFGVGEAEKIFVIVLSIFPYFLLLIADIVSHTPSQIIDAAKCLGAGSNIGLFRIFLSFNGPKIFDALRFMFAVGWAYLIMAEVVGSESGLGHFIMNSQRFLHTADMFSAIIIIALIGFLMDMLFRVLYGIFFPWAEKVVSDGRTAH